MSVLFFDYNTERQKLFYKRLLFDLGVADYRLNKTSVVVDDDKQSDFVATIPQISQDNLQKYWERVFNYARVAEEQDKRLLAIFFMDADSQIKDDQFIKQVIQFLTYHENVGKVFDIKIISMGLSHEISATIMTGANIAMLSYPDLESAQNDIINIIRDYFESDNLKINESSAQEDHPMLMNAATPMREQKGTNDSQINDSFIQMNEPFADGDHVPKKPSFLSKKWTEKISSVFSYFYDRKLDRGWFVSGIRGLFAVLFTFIAFIPVTVLHAGGWVLGKLVFKKHSAEESEMKQNAEQTQSEFANPNNYAVVQAEYFASKANEAEQFFAPISVAEVRSAEVFVRAPDANGRELSFCLSPLVTCKALGGAPGTPGPSKLPFGSDQFTSTPIRNNEAVERLSRSFR